jgi:SulP family sulfate permease
MSTEFAGQGLANLVASVGTGYPVSGSPARSGLNFRSGAQTRLSGILSGLVMLVILFAFGPLANYMPLAAIAGLILVIAIDLIDLQKIRTVMRSGLSDRSAFLATLFGTWLMPLDKAIYLGVGISLVLFLRKARFLVVNALTLDVDNRFMETDPNEINQICPSIRILEIEGRLFFGVEGELQHLLDEEINRPEMRVLLLRLKRTQGLDITVATVLQDVAKRLRQEGRTLVLAGLRKDALRLLEQVGFSEEIGHQNLFAEQSPWFADEDRALQHACALVEPCCQQCPFRNR